MSEAVGATGSGLAESVGRGPGQVSMPVDVVSAFLPLPTGAATDGTDGTGITPPTGGTSIRGWLSGIYSKLTGTVATSRTWTLSSATDSISVIGGASTDVTDRAARLLGHVSVDTAPTTAVTGTFWQATQPISGTVTANPPISGTTVKAAATTLTTTAVTANQVIATYTVTTAKTLLLQAASIQARLTTLSATGAILGTASLQIGGVTVATFTFTNPTSEQVIPVILDFNDLPIPAATVVQWVCTPASTTSMLWVGNIAGFEQ